MKKLLSLVLALAMLCCMVSALADDAGVWYLNSMVLDGTTYNPADMGMTITLTLNADGTGSMDSNGEVSELTWTSDDTAVTLVMDGEETVLARQDIGLVIDDEGVSMVFGTEAPVAMNLGETVAAADLSAFNGTWSCTNIGMEGLMLPASSLGDSWETIFGSADTTIVIADGVVTVCGSDAQTFTFADGQLTCSEEDNELSAQSITLTDAGYLVYTMDALGLSLYCQPAAQ